MGGNNLRDRLDDVGQASYGLGAEVELTEGQRVVDTEAGNCFDKTSRATTVVCQLSDLGDVTTVADFDHIKRDDVTREVVLKEQRRVQTNLTEVTLEDINRRDVGRGFRITIKCTNHGLGIRATGRGSREHEVREGALKSWANESVVILELTSLAVDTREDVLHNCFSESSRTDCRNLRSRQAEV